VQKLALASALAFVTSLLSMPTYAEGCGSGPSVCQWRCTQNETNQSADVSSSTNGVKANIQINHDDQSPVVSTGSAGGQVTQGPRAGQQYQGPGLSIPGRVVPGYASSAPIDWRSK
jgi:hypothetical protein